MKGWTGLIFNMLIVTDLDYLMHAVCAISQAFSLVFNQYLSPDNYSHLWYQMFYSQRIRNCGYFFILKQCSFIWILIVLTTHAKHSQLSALKPILPQHWSLVHTSFQTTVYNTTNTHFLYKCDAVTEHSVVSTFHCRTTQFHI